MPKFSINECNEKLFKLPNAENLLIVNKQVDFLMFQYVGTCKSAYTKDYAQN